MWRLSNTRSDRLARYNKDIEGNCMEHRTLFDPCADHPGSAESYLSHIWETYDPHLELFRMKLVRKSPRQSKDQEAPLVDFEMLSNDLMSRPQRHLQRDEQGMKTPANTRHRRTSHLPQQTGTQDAATFHQERKEGENDRENNCRIHQYHDNDDNRP